MNAFIQTVKDEQVVGRTFNNAKTNSTSGNYVLDFFNAAGNRSVTLDREFDLAHGVDSKLAFRVALWTRDIRSGAGERQTFRNLLLHFEKHFQEELIALLPKIPELGRWDDIFIFTNPQVKKAALELIKSVLTLSSVDAAGKVGLLAKWLPRKGSFADDVRRHLNWNWRTYRKTIVAFSKTVEQQMCAKQWNEIVFDQVPSVASARYQKAFFRNCPEAYKAYREGLKKVKPDGTTERKINASSIFPYDVIKSVRSGVRDVAEAQWNALPNYLGEDYILPLIDTSGSMTMWGYYGQRDNMPGVTPMDIALSIGLYVADKQTGPFQNAFLTFESRPKLQVLSGDLASKVIQAERAPWGGSTNIEAAFDKILEIAKKANASEAEMPKVLLILSDMEFNQCIEGAHRGQDTTAYESFRLKYERAGYKLPKVVFWAINGRSDNNPVKFLESGTALVSGFSPSIFKALLRANLEDYTPYNVMLEALKNPLYDVEGVTV